MVVSPALAFQAAAAVSTTRLRHTLPLSPRRPPRPARRPRLAYRVVPTRLTAPAPANVLVDKEVLVPSTIPEDRHHPVKVALRAEGFPARRRRVVGGVDIPVSKERVWAVLTAYARMEEYIPNIISSTVEEKDGQLFLDQIGLISRKLGLKSRLLVRILEDTSKGEIVFERVSARDFSQFVGKYFVKEDGDGGVRLDYEMDVVPFPLFPMAMVERKIFKEVPIMLAAVREEAMLGRVVKEG